MTVGPVFEASRRHSGCARMRRYVAMALSAFTLLQVRVSLDGYHKTTHTHIKNNLWTDYRADHILSAIINISIG